MNQEIQILVGDKPAKQFGFNNQTYIEARDGIEYAIKIKNNSAARVEAVCSIDGLDVISGTVASKDNRGYIIPAYGSTVIRGFRTSDEKVNAFKFANKEKSYAANNEESGYSDQHCGAIGVIIFPEKIVIPKKEKEYVPHYIPVDRPYPVYPKPEPYYPSYPWVYPQRPPFWYGDNYTITTNTYNTDDSQMYRMQSSINYCNNVDTPSANSTNAPFIGYSKTVDFDLGTEFSDHEVHDKVTTTEFQRGRQGSTFIIYYASRKALEEIGIEFNKETKIANFPSPFPKDDSGYCKPPARRK